MKFLCLFLMGCSTSPFDIFKIEEKPITCEVDGGDYQKNVIWPGHGCPPGGLCAITDDDGGVLGYGVCK